MRAKCPECGEMFDAMMLHDHILDAHSSDPPAAEMAAASRQGHVCGICGRAFSTPEELKQHNMTAHRA